MRSYCSKRVWWSVRCAPQHTASSHSPARRASSPALRLASPLASSASMAEHGPMKSKCLEIRLASVLREKLPASSAMGKR